MLSGKDTYSTSDVNSDRSNIDVYTIVVVVVGRSRRGRGSSSATASSRRSDSDKVRVGCTSDPTCLTSFLYDSLPGQCPPFHSGLVVLPLLYILDHLLDQMSMVSPRVDSSGEGISVGMVRKGGGARQKAQKGDQSGGLHREKSKKSKWG